MEHNFTHGNFVKLFQNQYNWLYINILEFDLTQNLKNQIMTTNVWLNQVSKRLGFKHEHDTIV